MCLALRFSWVWVSYRPVYFNYKSECKVLGFDFEWEGKKLSTKIAGSVCVHPVTNVTHLKPQRRVRNFVTCLYCQTGTAGLITPGKHKLTKQFVAHPLGPSRGTSVHLFFSSTA